MTEADQLIDQQICDLGSMGDKSALKVPLYELENQNSSTAMLYLQPTRDLDELA